MGDNGISFTAFQQEGRPVGMNTIRRGGVTRARNVYFDQASYEIDFVAGTTYTLKSAKCVGRRTRATDACALSKAPYDQSLDASAVTPSVILAKVFGVTTDNLPGRFGLFLGYVASDEYRGPTPATARRPCCGSRRLAASPVCSAAAARACGRPSSGHTSRRAATRSTGRRCATSARGAGLCNVPADVLAGLDAKKFYFPTAFRARLLTAVQTNGSGKGGLSSLVKDGADETRLAATDGPVNRTLQPFWAPGDAFARIDPVAAVKNVVVSNMSARGDWAHIHFKEEISTGVFFPGCNNPQFAGLDQNPCMHPHENWLNRMPGVDTTYSKGQKVPWYDLVFRAGSEESPDHASSIDNGEALGTPLGGGVTLLGKDLVPRVELIAASRDCAPAAGAGPGGLDNTTRPCIVFPQGIFTPR